MMMHVETLPRAPKHDPDGTLLPYNLDAERSVLGAAIVEQSAADWAVEHLTADAFFRRAHADIFRAMATLREARQQIDFVTLKTELLRVKRLDEVGGPAYVSALADGIPRASNIEYYARILRDLQVKRALIHHAEHTIDLVCAGEHGGEAVLHDADRRLLEIQAGHIEGRMRSLRDTAAERIRRLEWRYEHAGELLGIDTGYQGINDNTLGWAAGDLIIIAARPSIGKTTLAINSVVHGAATCRRVEGVGTNEAVRAAVFSLEMRRNQIEDRILSQLSNVPLTRIQGGSLGSKDFERINQAMHVMDSLKIEIDDRAGQTALDIRAACRRMKSEGGLDIVVVDYVQLMPGTLERKSATRNDEITDIARRLKDLGDEISAPVLLCSQLRRTDGRPRIEDLRESGSLEQAADIVGLLHRKDHRASGTTEFILAKQRNGPTGTIYLSIDRDTVTFTDGEEPAEPAPEERSETSRRIAAGRARRKAMRASE